jgi:hypothetical protein
VLSQHPAANTIGKRVCDEKMAAIQMCSSFQSGVPVEVAFPVVQLGVHAASALQHPQDN